MVSQTKTPERTDKPLLPDVVGKMDAYWRAANYLSHALNAVAP